MSSRQGRNAAFVKSPQHDYLKKTCIMTTSVDKSTWMRKFPKTLPTDEELQEISNG